MNADGVRVDRWSAGSSCMWPVSASQPPYSDIPPCIDGPVLSQTDLYLLKPTLQINPILTKSNPAFNLIFDLATGVFHRCLS